MKHIKNTLIAFCLVTAVGFSLAFNIKQNYNGTLYCSTLPGGDCSTVKYESGGPGVADKYCRDVTNPGTCPTNGIRAVIDQ